jgi:N-acetylmuramoyl-L-alanine amidase
MRANQKFPRRRGYLAWMVALPLLSALLLLSTLLLPSALSSPGTTFGRASVVDDTTSSPPPDSVAPFGTTAVGANAVSHPAAPIVGMASTPNGGGYWMVGSDGGVFSYGDAKFYGSEGGAHLNAPVVGMAAAPSGGGYWLVASDGGVFAFGDANFYGSMGGRPLNQPIVGMAATPNGGGYWLVASDGGVFAFGDATFDGSMGGRTLNKPVVGMAAAAPGGGYWLVASDGGVFAFGDATFDGSMGGRPLSKPIVGMASAPNGGGYWLVASDGGVFALGNATFYGSAAAIQPAAPAVGMAAVPGGGGYWLAFGTPQPLAGKIVGIDPGHNGLNWTDTGYIDQQVWNGREYEDCDTTGTATDSGYTEAQYNFNVATYLKQDLEAEGAQVVMTRLNNSGVGPCVTTRAAIINDAHADVAVDIHADGGPPGGRGFAVLEPVADGPNDGVIGTSDEFASIVRNDFLGTGMPLSSYDGIDGLQPRNNLAGLNLTTVPKVLIECGNMRNATDASMLITASFQQAAAAEMARAITTFLNG